MADVQNLITPENIKANIFGKSFRNEAHPYFVLYDDLMDELIIKLTPPNELAVEFSISDTFSLLVNPVDHEVVGIQLLEFTKDHLPNMPLAQRAWKDHKMAEAFSRFNTCEYRPTKPVEENFYFYPQERIEQALTVCAA